MAFDLQALLELPPTQGGVVEKHIDLERDTMLSRMVTRTERCKTAYRWDKETGLKALAPATGRGAASKTVNIRTPSVQQIGGVFFRINHKFSGEELRAIRNPGGMSDNAAALVQKTRVDLHNRLKLSKEKLWSMALAGTTTIDSSTFPDGTVEGVSISWGVTTLAVSASWALVATYILDDIDEMQEAIREASGAQIREFIYRNDIKKYVRKNTQVSDWAKEQPRGADILANAPGQFATVGGIEKWTQYEGFYQPEGGSVTYFVPANRLLAIPEGAENLMLEARFEMDRPASSGGLVLSGDEIPQATYGDEDGIDDYAYQTPDAPSITLVSQMGIQPILLLPESFGVEANVTS